MFSLARNVLNPVIIETKENKFLDTVQIIKQAIPDYINNFLGFRLNLGERITNIISPPEVNLFSKFKEMKLFNMFATILPGNLLEEVLDMREVEGVYPDRLVFALEAVPEQGVFRDQKGRPFTSTYWTKRLMGIDLFNEKGFRGQGVNACIIDSGARKSHPQLYRVRTLSAAPEKGMSGLDSNGHGTWCVSCVGGSYAIDSKLGVPVEGMAPECNLISIQSLGYVIGCGSSSDVIKAMEMAYNLGADVVSMSLGSNPPSPPDDKNPEAKAVKKLTEAGIVCCIAAGNSGPGEKTIGSPGSALDALTVGAWDPIKSELAYFSSRGPTAGDGYIKPDVVAPGVRIHSATVGLIDSTDYVSTRYAPISGTSMATPHVAGLVTVMKQVWRELLGKNLTTEEIKTMMEQLGHEKNNETGWGFIDAYKFNEWLSTQYGIEAV